MDTLIYILIAGFMTALIVWLFHIHESIQWLKKERSVNTNTLPSSSTETCLIIPLLDESQVIAKTVNYFDSNFLTEDVPLILVTTQNEKNYVQTRIQKFHDKIEKFTDVNLLDNFVRDTFEDGIDKSLGINEAKKRAKNIASKFANTIKLAQRLSKKYSNVHHVHYPRIEGKMAHQLNYAINIIKQEKDSLSDLLFGIYNADSRPEPETLEWVHRKYENGEARVFQQYGSYIQSHESNSYSFEHVTSLSARWWQTRWSVGFEINHALHQSDKKSKLTYPMNYCIGHGLFMNKEIYNAVNGFEEDTYNEDAILGLQLSHMQELIQPVPYFDQSDAPSSTSCLFRQQMNWYMGPLQSFDYYSYLADGLSREKKMYLLLLCAKLFSHAIYWVAGPVLLFALLLLSFTHSHLLIFLCSLILAYAYLMLPVFWVKKVLSDLFNRDLQYSLGLNAFIATLFFYLLHGSAGVASIIRFTYYSFRNKQIEKGTTKMD